MVKNRLADEKVLNSDNPEALHWSALSKYCGVGTAENEEEAFKLFEISAKNGYTPSQRALAFCYKNGIGVKKDLFSSLRWQTIAKIRSINKIKLLVTSVFFLFFIFCFYLTFFTTFVAEKLLLKGYFNASFYLFKILEKEDNPKSYYFLGLHHLYALGNLNQDAEKAEIFMRKGMNAKDNLATFSTAFFLTEKPEEKETIIRNTFNTILKMAENGDPFAQNETGKIYYETENYDKAFYWWSESAKQGYVAAHNNIALCYSEGKGVAQNKEKAVEIYKKLAEKNNFITSQKNLANYYYNKNNKKLSPESCEWYEQAALQGDTDAQNKLGLCYNKGYENWKARNEFESCKWFEKAAVKGHTVAQFYIGQCYYKGVGVNQKNTEKGCEWFEKAALQGLAEAQYNLAICYSKGDGKEKNKVESCKWYEKAANNGVADAQYRLFRCYFDKDGLGKNDEKAKYWLRKAARQNHREAINMLRGAFNEKVDPEEIESK